MQVSYNDTGFCIRAQGFSVAFPDTPSNRKVAVIFLRGMRDAQGKGLFTLKQLAEIVHSANRQAASAHVEGFRACGEDFGATLQRTVCPLFPLGLEGPDKIEPSPFSFTSNLSNAGIVSSPI